MGMVIVVLGFVEFVNVEFLMGVVIELVECIIVF